MWVWVDLYYICNFHFLIVSLYTCTCIYMLKVHISSLVILHFSFCYWQLKKLIKTPYVILAIIIIISGLFFFFVFFYLQPKCTTKSNAETKQSDRDRGEPKHDKWFRIRMLALMFAFFFVYLWLEAVSGRFIALFVVKGLGWRNKYGALITSLYWGSNGVGRVIGIALSTVMKPRNMIMTDMIITTFATILLWFSPLHYGIPWVGSAILGYGLATMFAATVLWVDDYIEVTGSASGVFLAGASCGSMTAPLLTGILFEDFGHMWFVYIIFGANCVLIAIYIATLLHAKRHGRRQKPADDDKPNDYQEDQQGDEENTTLRVTDRVW